MHGNYALQFQRVVLHNDVVGEWRWVALGFCWSVTDVAQKFDVLCDVVLRFRLSDQTVKVLLLL